LSKTSRPLRFLASLGKALFWTLAGLVVLMASTLGLGLGTSPGRAFVVRAGLGIANKELPGTLELEALERIDLSRIELRGIVVRDAQGEVVARAQSLTIDYLWREIVRGRYILENVVLTRAWVDLGTLGESERGIISAFVDPDAPPSPPSSAALPYVEVKRAAVRQSFVHLPSLPKLGSIDIRQFDAEGRFVLDGSPFVNLSSCSFALERKDRPLGRLKSLQAVWQAGGTSTAAFELELLSSRLGAQARGVLPTEPGYADEPLEIRLSAQNIVARDLGELFQESELASSFEHAIDLELRVSGTPKNAAAELDVRTSGGALFVKARAEEFQRIELNLQTAGLRAQKVRKELPPEPLDIDVTTRANAHDPSAIQLELDLSRGRLGEHELPQIKASAVLGPKDLRQILVALKDGPSRAQVEGQLGFDGSFALESQLELASPTLATAGRLAGVPGKAAGTVNATFNLRREAEGQLAGRGKARVRSLTFGKNKVASAALAFNLAGKAPNLRGHLELKAHKLILDTTKVEFVALDVRGGPSRYSVVADVRQAELAERAQLTAGAHLDLEWAASHFGLAGQIAGQLGQAPLRLEIAPSRYEPRRSVYETQGISLRLGEHTLRVQGRADPSRVDVQVASDGALDLRLLSDLLPLNPPLSGRARIRGRAHGTLALPFVEVDAELERVTLGERPPVDGDFHAALDAEHGKVTFVGKVLGSDPGPRGFRQLDLEGKLDHHFQPGPGYARHLLRGRPEGHLELRALDLAFVEAWSGATLPVTGHLGAMLEAGGTWQSPSLSLKLRSKLRARGDARVLDADGELSLVNEHWQTDWSVTDAKGSWITMSAAAVTPPSTAEEDPFVSRLSSLPAHGQWQVKVEVAPRPLAELPVLRFEKDLPPATLSAKVELAHEPEQEPRGNIHGELVQFGDSTVLGACQGDRVRLDLDLGLGEAKWQAELKGRSRGEILFHSRAAGRLRLAPLLTSGALELGPIEATLSAKQLRLETLPYICSTARGELSAELKLVDPLGAKPEFQGDLTVRNFRASPLPPGVQTRKDELLDVEAHLGLNAERAELRAALFSGKNRSTLEAHLPIHYQKGAISIPPTAPLDAHLKIVHLPISPLLNPRGSISYASGTIDGWVDLRGSRAAPRFQGGLELERVAFTATDLAQPLHEVQGRLRFSEREAHLEGFEAKDGDGRLALDGHASFERLDRIESKFHVRAKQFPLRQMGQVVAHLDLDARVDSKVLPEQTDVAVGIASADMWIENAKFRTGIALEPHPDFVIDGAKRRSELNPETGGPLPPRAPASEAAAASAPPVQGHGAAPGNAISAQSNAQPPHVTRIKLKSQERFWIKRDDFAVNLAANLNTELASDHTSVEGEVLIERGYLTLLGKTFEFEKGSKLNFIGGATPDPVIDLTATFHNRRTGDEVKVHITGRGSKPVIAFLVNDKRSEAGDAFSAIYGSQGTNQSSKSAPEQAAGFVGGLTAGLLATSARKELGAAAPIIMIERRQAKGACAPVLSSTRSCLAS
jgi:autotransporter translocation and assembly factor TamB